MTEVEAGSICKFNGECFAALSAFSTAVGPDLDHSTSLAVGGNGFQQLQPLLIIQSYPIAIYKDCTQLLHQIFHLIRFHTQHAGKT